MACNILSIYNISYVHTISASAAIGRLGGKEKWSFFFCCFIDRGGFVRRKAPTAAQYIPTPFGFWREQIGASGGNRKRKLAKGNNQYINTRWGMFQLS
jgi:hypothetical protein